MKINIGVFYIKKPISIHFQKQHDKEGVFKQWIWAECAATKPHLHKTSCFVISEDFHHI